MLYFAYSPCRAECMKITIVTTSSIWILLVSSSSESPETIGWTFPSRLTGLRMNSSSPNFLQLRKLSITKKFATDPKTTTNSIVVSKTVSRSYLISANWLQCMNFLGPAPPPAHNLLLQKGAKVAQAAVL